MANTVVHTMPYIQTTYIKLPILKNTLSLTFVCVCIYMCMQTVSKIHKMFLKWAQMCTIILKFIYPHIDNYLLYHKKSSHLPHTILFFHNVSSFLKNMTMLNVKTCYNIFFSSLSYPL